MLFQVRGNLCGYRGLSFARLAALCVIATSAWAQPTGAVPLKNWAAPLYWHSPEGESALGKPNAEGRAAEVARVVSPAAVPLASISSAPLAFVALTPCRVVDTRIGSGFTGAFGPPSLAAGGLGRTFPLQSSSTCSIPSTALAYSLNITVVPPGLLGFITVSPTGQSRPPVSTLNDLTGTIVANAAIVPAGTSGSIDVYASSVTDVIIDINGYYAATQTQIVVPAGINDFTEQFGSPTQGKVSYGPLIPVPCWTLPQAGGGSCIIATTVIPPGVTTPTVIVDVQASSAGTASVNLGSTGVAANAAPPSNCISFNTTQNLTFTAANTMQRFSANINTLGVCGSSPPAVAGAGDILVFRICNNGTLDFSVTSVQFLWK